MRIRATIATIGLACGLVLFGGTPASAESGTAWSLTLHASTRFDDSVDKYTVCDKSANDGYLAVGWIEVFQADGSWRQFPKVVVTGDFEHCTTKDIDVLSENKPVIVWACLKEPQGARTDCGHKSLLGS